MMDITTRKFFWLVFFSSLPIAILGLYSVSLVLTVSLLVYAISLTGHFRTVFRFMPIPFISALFAFNFNVELTLIYVLQLIVVSFAIGYGLKTKRSFAFTMLLASVPDIMFRASSYISKLKLIGFNSLSQAVKFSIDNINSMPESLPGLDAYKQMLANINTEYLTLIDVIMPSTLVIFSIINCYIILALVKRMLSKNGKEVSYLPYIYELHISKELSMVFLFFVALQLVLGVMAKVSLFSFNVSINIAIIFIFLFMAVGLSFVDYYLKFKGIHGAFRLLIYFLLFFASPFTGAAPQFVILTLVTIAILDSFINFRNRIYEGG